MCSRRRVLIRAGISVTIPYIFSNRINCTLENKENRGEGNCDKQATEMRIYSGRPAMGQASSFSRIRDRNQTFTHTHSVGLLWRNNRPDAETTT